MDDDYSDSDHYSPAGPIRTDWLCPWPILRVKKVSKHAILPKKSTSESAGFDLYSAEGANLDPHCRRLFDTGLAMAIPKGYYGRIAPRSGLAIKHGIDVLAGVIDSDYRGVVKVILINFGEEDMEIAKGSRIAQLILEKYASDAIIEEVTDLPNTTRGEGGFGSTGV